MAGGSETQRPGHGTEAKTRYLMPRRMDHRMTAMLRAAAVADPSLVVAPAAAAGDPRIRGSARDASDPGPPGAGARADAAVRRACS